ncbi:intraflagellar transport protein 46 homolog isoform X4 [Dromiciops gliroides]|uniref:intraflagellar transport protein 46 homolog isoform X4 n=1 Tax=Dromiciops gliroides TaxID=33562 RepID=UPI001CC6F495|nr:intraflagellar transport protein 46 homolog isoform X4 [Dromiciops gliroides]
MEETDSEGLQTKVVENQPYDESLEINDSEEVASIYTPTPRHQGLPLSSRLPPKTMADNSSDEYEEENNKVPREGIPQPPGHRGKDSDPAPPAPASPKRHHAPSRGPERVGWYIGSQKLRKEKKKTTQLATQRGFSENEDEDEDDDSSETDSDEDDDDEEHGAPLEGAYDPADYEHLPVSAEIKELFQYITRYTPQLIDLDHKLKPFIPDFIPAVGDIDAFLKVPRPDGKPDNLGLLVLDEPSTKQSDPTVLSLWLTENSKQHNITVSLPTADIDCSLAEYIDIICAILDIPVYKSRIQSLHLLFSLYSEFKNSQHFKALAEGKKAATPPSNPTSQAGDAETLTFS